ncbi:prostaglandin-E(2) 9-reductase-like [Gastrophryne carolinensis]
MALTRSSVAVLNDGHTIPLIGLGTYDQSESMAEEAVKMAIDAGYRHIDSASAYKNEVAVGLGINAKIADGTVKREDIFYTTKLHSTLHAPNLVRPALESSLKDLKLNYIDLFLIHTPLALKPGNDPEPKHEIEKYIYDNTDLRDTWKAMEECKAAGLTKSIGVSNFNRKQLEYILNMPGLRYKPVCNQVECHIYLNQSKMLEFCKPHGIKVVAYGALGSTRDPIFIDQTTPILLEDPVLNTIAQKRGRSPAQVALRFLLQRGVITLAKSFKPERIRQNLEVFDFELSDEEMKTLNGRNQNRRYLLFDMFKDHPYYPFSEDVFNFQLSDEEMKSLNERNMNRRYDMHEK